MLLLSIVIVCWCLFLVVVVVDCLSWFDCRLVLLLWCCCLLCVKCCLWMFDGACLLSVVNFVFVIVSCVVVGLMLVDRCCPCSLLVMSCLLLFVIGLPCRFCFRVLLYIVSVVAC